MNIAADLIDGSVVSVLMMGIFWLIWFIATMSAQLKQARSDLNGFGKLLDTKRYNGEKCGSKPSEDP